MIGRGFDSRRLQGTIPLPLMKTYIKLFAILSLLVTAPLFSVSVTFRCSDYDDFSRVVFEADSRFTFDTQLGESQVQLVVTQVVGFERGVVVIENSPLIDRALFEVSGGRTVLTVLCKKPIEVKKNFVLENPFRIVFDLKASGRAAAPRQERADAEGGEAAFQTTPVAATANSIPKPIETICLDPGHGGDDLGAVGRSKLQEKNITLNLSRKLKKMIESRLGLRVIMTRDGDTETLLDTRASVANNQQAQMFVSIHVNSSFRRSAYGSEIYFVSLQATDQEALELAAKENQNEGEQKSTPGDDDLKMILWNMAQTEYIRDSSRLAEYIQAELNELLNTRNRGVKQAPFRVLMRAAMPAVLIEVAFLSNSSEEKLLQSEAFLDRVATAIFNGISKFIYYYNQTLK